MSLTIEPATLAPFEIWEVLLDDSTIKFHEPLVLEPYWLEDDSDDPDENEYLAVEHPELAISSYGINYDELVSAVQSDIRFAWKHFVQTDDTQLTADARAIKDYYLSIAEVIDG